MLTLHAKPTISPTEKSGTFTVVTGNSYEFVTSTGKKHKS